MVDIDQEKCRDPYLRCAFYGAAQTALGIRGCCVLSHSPQGCNMLVGAAFGWQDADYTETHTLCTKLCENEIVFGGEELLYNTILESSEMKVPLVFVLSACGPEIVGDNIEAVCERAQKDVDFIVVPIESAGFHGNQYDGADIAIDVLLKKLVPPQREKVTGSVCLVAPFANANPTWMGDLTWAEKALARLGATDVVRLTHQTPLQDLSKVASCEFSIVLSHDCGQSAAEYLLHEYGIEQLCNDIPLPMGFTNTRRWLSAIGTTFGSKEIADKLIAEGESTVVEVCRRKGLEQAFMHRAPVAIVSDATIGIPLIHFLTEDLEMIPELICLRSSQENAKQILSRELDDLALHPTIIYDSDVYQSRAAVGKAQPEIVFGSNIERHAVEKFGIPFVFRLVNPESRFRLINKAYFGYEGMLNLIELMQNDWLEKYRSKNRRYQARW